jgi:hypothetical protein
MLTSVWLLLCGNATEDSLVDAIVEEEVLCVGRCELWAAIG